MRPPAFFLPAMTYGQTRNCRPFQGSLKMFSNTFFITPFLLPHFTWTSRISIAWELNRNVNSWAPTKIHWIGDSRDEDKSWCADRDLTSGFPESADSHGVNSPAATDFKPPVWCYWMRSWEEMLTISSPELIGRNCWARCWPRDLGFNELSGWFWLMLKFENYCSNWSPKSLLI